MHQKDKFCTVAGTAARKGWHVRHLLISSFVAFCHGVPRESPDFDPELHVPDMSESEDVPMAERSESEIGCHWTSRLKLQLCGGDGECHDGEILAFDFQRRAWAYYESLSEGVTETSPSAASLGPRRLKRPSGLRRCHPRSLCPRRSFVLAS